jgi:hypothetical protein
LVDKKFSNTISLQDVAIYASGIVIKPIKIGCLFDLVEKIRQVRQYGLHIMLGSLIQTQLTSNITLVTSSVTEAVDVDGHELIVDDPFVAGKDGFGFDLILQDKRLYWIPLAKYTYE